MVTTVSRHAFVTLTLSAKLHKLLDLAGNRQQHTHKAAIDAFDKEVGKALNNLHSQPTKNSSQPTKNRSDALRLLKADFDVLEHLYHDMCEHRVLSESVTEKFDRIFATLSEKIKEKELRT